MTRYWLLIMGGAQDIPISLWILHMRHVYMTWPPNRSFSPSGHQIACTPCRMGLQSLTYCHCDLHKGNIAGLCTLLCSHKLHKTFLGVPIPAFWEVSNVPILRRVCIFIVYPWNKILMQLAGKINIVASPFLTSSKQSVDAVCRTSIICGSMHSLRVRDIA